MKFLDWLTGKNTKNKFEKKPIRMANEDSKTEVNAEILMDALKANEHENALKLVRNVNSVNYMDSTRASLLYIATSKGYLDVCEILINKGAKLDLQAANGGTALIMASQRGNFSIVKLLLDKGAKINLLNNKGFTALMAASANGHTDIIKLLLDKGANPNSKSKEGKIAYDYAEKSEIETLLSKSKTISETEKSVAVNQSKDDSLFNDLAAVNFDPRQFPRVFRKVDAFRVDKLPKAFGLKEVPIDFFYDGDRPKQVPGTRALLVRSDRTNSIPEEPDAFGGKHLECRLLFIKTKDNEVYCLGTDERGQPLTDMRLDRFVYSATSSV